MTKINDGGPAFPTGFTDDSGFAQEGMALRDWFAGQAILTAAACVGEFQQPSLDMPAEAIATRAYEIADAMLAARSVGR